MKNKDLLSQYLIKHNISYKKNAVLARLRPYNNKTNYVVNGKLELDILAYLLENAVIVNKLIGKRIVPKECIPLSCITQIPLTDPNIFSNKSLLRILKTSDPITKVRSMYIDEAYWFLDFIFKYLRRKEVITHSETTKMLIKAMERIRE